ncbi:hypothetical protein [Nitrospira japonica]|nr:hypothetical protein [Nitrospira japonica]
MMDTPVVVDSARSLLKTIRSLLEMVWQDLQVERANRVISSNTISQAMAGHDSSGAMARQESRKSNSFKYHPADW